MLLSSDDPFPADASLAAQAFARLEALVRACIDPVARRVCPSCPAPCCRVCYCRETARNPWYRFVCVVAGDFSFPPDWEARNDPFGLGEDGCSIRAGRYAFCYSYTCRRMRNAVSPGARNAFQEVSDLLLLPNRLPGGRLLHEIQRVDQLGEKDLRSIGRQTARALTRLAVLRRDFFDPLPPLRGPQSGGRYLV